MKKHPFVFSGNILDAFLKGGKTQMRQVLKPQPVCQLGMPAFWKWKDCQWADGGIGFPESGVEDHALYEIGDIFLIKEKNRRYPSGIALRITGVRVERLQAISEDDASAEGFGDYPKGCIVPRSNPIERVSISCIDWFKDYWDSANDKYSGCSFGVITLGFG